MLITGLVLLVVGLAAAGACFFWRKSSRKKAGWWSSVEDLDVAAAVKREAGAAVAVSGAGGAPVLEDGTPMLDPLRDQPACWWRETVTEHWEERVRVTTSSNSANTSGSQRDEYRWEDRSNQISEQTSGLPFTVTDGAAALKIDPHGIDIDDDLLHRNQSQQREGGSAGVAEAIIDGLLSTNGGRRNAYVETAVSVLPVGTRVLVSGRTGAGGTVVADPEHGLKVYEGTVQSQLGESRKAEQRAHLGFAIGLGAAALGVVLTAVGAAVG